MRNFINATLLLLLVFSGCGKDKLSTDVPVDDLPTIKTQLKNETTLYGLIVDKNNQPFPNLWVTDGYTMAKTDENGVYQLVRHKKAKFVYYSIPADGEIMVDDKYVPQFYQKIVKKDKVIRHDFVLNKQNVDEKFTLFAIADPQVRNANEISRYKNETIKDILGNVSKYPNVLALTLGDIVFDTPELFGEMKKLMLRSELPFFHAIGNHDHLQTATSEDKGEEQFRNALGPTYYSIDRSNTHIIVVDNVIYEDKQIYRGGLLPEHWEWMKEDLAHVDKDKLVLFACHIPFRAGSTNNHIDYYTEILNLLSTFKEAHILNGHTHYNQNYVHTVNGKKIYEHIHGTAGGAWWNSTICSDGTPNGYAIYEIEGNAINNWKYKSTNYPDDFQMRVYDGAYAFGPTNKYNYMFGASVNLSLSGSGWVVANVWNADDDWKIELYNNGTKVQDMTKRSTRDFWATYYHLETLGKTKDSDFDKSLGHFYVGKLPVDLSKANFEVRATDRFGNIYRSNTLKSDFFGIGGY